MKNLKLNFTGFFPAFITLVLVLFMQAAFAQQPANEQKPQRNEQKATPSSTEQKKQRSEKDATEPTTEQKKQRSEKDATEPTTEQKQQRGEQSATDAKEPTAEQQQKRDVQEKSSVASMSDEDIKKNYNDRMKRYNDNYDRLSQRAANTDDPQMKADISKLQSQMNEAKTSLDNFISNKDSMTPEQMERARTSLRAQDEQLQKNYDALKAKYANTGSGKTEMNKEKSTQKRAADADAPAERTPKQ